MNFAEVRFWELLGAGLGVIFVLRALMAWLRPAGLETYDRLALFGLGLYLLLCISQITFLIFLAVALGTYWGLKWILHHEPKQRHRYLYLLIPLQLLPLFHYKYSNFVANQVLGLDQAWLRDLVIPVGISFYTFQKVAFAVDTLAFNHPLPKFLDYLNFAGFFPQIVAGPIERRADLLPQMESFRFRWLPSQIEEGAGFLVLGLFFKCCLADNLAAYFDPRSTSNPFLIWTANVLFGLRIYYDFAGYSLVALGIARCLGVRLTLNFNSPYCSTNMVEFWRRWHITLSQWFRDYLYLPLGGGRVKYWAFNMALVFVVSGVWHGAGWNFVLWGALHAVFLILNHSLRKKLSMPRVVAWGFTMICSFFSWLCFYEVNLAALVQKSVTLLQPQAYNLEAFRQWVSRWPGGDRFVLSSFLALSALVLLMEWRSVVRGQEPYYWLRRPAVLCILVVLTMLLSPGKNNGFIYFAF
ncbi:MAG: MBOAT family protein [Verrucomicrobiales bacterium]|nr:MBOAT family protein [Verrucomicrobiales bacterium]